MKKLILVMTAMCIVAISNAQVPGFTFGPKIGLNLSHVTTNVPSITDQMKAGYDLGVFARFGEKCYFQPELLFATNGVKFTAPTGSPSEIKLNSIKVPLLFGARIVNLKIVNVRLLGGPVASFLVNKNVTYNGAIDQTKVVSVKNANWGVQFGAGVDVLMFTLDVRYNYDFNKQIQQQANEFKWDQQAVNVTLGWKIF